ncbi:uncharacterized protein [Periplaneta americana]|uniref:uncharacterized protein isoform X2 n=1 Tax=Periplaneta americana TaxID=6978 RepID=UPI0037E84A38
MDLIKVEPDVDYEIPQTDPISNMKDEEECIIPFIKTEAREIDFEWEPESENVGDEKNPPDYESDGETHQTSPTSDAKKEEGRRTVNCREMKSEVKVWGSIPLTSYPDSGFSCFQVFKLMWR